MCDNCGADKPYSPCLPEMPGDEPDDAAVLNRCPTRCPTCGEVYVDFCPECTPMVDVVREWAWARRWAVVGDVWRLGLERAADYNLCLLRQAIQDGDDRWRALLPRCGADSHRAMVDALAELVPVGDDGSDVRR